MWPLPAEKAASETPVARACEKTIANIRFYRERLNGTLGPYKHERASVVCMSRYESARLLAMGARSALIVHYNDPPHLETPMVYNLHSIEEDILTWGPVKSYWVNRLPGEARARREAHQMMEEDTEYHQCGYGLQGIAAQDDVVWFISDLVHEGAVFEFKDNDETLTCGSHTWRLSREDLCYEMVLYS